MQGYFDDEDSYRVEPPEPVGPDPVTAAAGPLIIDDTGSRTLDQTQRPTGRIDTGVDGIDAVPGVDNMINRDWQSWEGALKGGAAERNLAYSNTDLWDVIRNVSYAQNAGRDPREFLDVGLRKYDARAASEGSGHGEDGGGPVGLSALSGGGGGAPSYPGAPQSIQPFTEQFRAPTLDEATNSPGFQFRLREGVKALQRSAASKGTLLTGGTLKDLQGYAQGQASDEYDKVYDRAIGEYQQRYGINRTNETDRFASERANRGDDFGFMDTDRRFDRDLTNDQWGRGLDLFNMNRVSRNDVFDQNYRLSDLARLSRPT